MSTDIRVALVYEQDAGTQTLRTALANAGVSVAVECRASALDSSAILDAEVDAIVVNLDAELEELLDEVTEALDAATQPVIYNDPAASSDLSGWDRARWMRHLSAKLKGQSNVTPPPPPGAQAIPMPAPKAVMAQAPVAPAAIVETSATPQVAAPESVAEIAASEPGATATETTPDFDIGDLDLMFEAPPASTSGGEAAHERNMGESPPAPDLVAAPDNGLFDVGIADLDLMFEAPPTSASGPAPAIAGGASADAEVADDFGMADLDSMFDEPTGSGTAEVASQPQSLVVGEDIGDLDSLFGDGAEIGSDDSASALVGASAGGDTVELELDSLFAGAGDSEAPQPPGSVATPSELTDLDTLFREFEASQSGANVLASPADAEKGDKPPVASPEPVASPSVPLEWSLEPVEEELPPTPQGDRLVTEWRLDIPSKPVAKTEPAPMAATPSAKAPPAPAIPADLDASLALADFQLLDHADLAPEQAAPASSAVLESFDLSSLDLESIEPAASASVAGDLGDELSLADLDFDFAPAQSPAGESRDSAPALDVDAGLDDLDSLFAAAPQAPLPGLALADLERVFVLGASIGGPEAIKAFLAQLPKSVPAAFIVAQHMGAEFLEMMAAQLDAASPLPVRCPKSGERLRHGEVIVAPANEQLVIDSGGHVQLSAAASGSPYNPSIDHLVRAAADRFGDHATLILFSGMGSDAVEGGRYLTSRGGQVWAQDRASCVIASMIESAKSQGLIRFEGTPAQLADRVLQVLS